MEFFGAVLERHGDMFEQQALQFGGTFGEMFTCLGCRRESVLNRHESFVTLGVEAEDGELCELVDRYLVQKALRKWCEQCGRNTKHSSRKYVEVWGTHLLVQVERFNREGGKVEEHSPVVESFVHDDVAWRLSGVIVHVGQTVEEGHYICYARRGATWYRCSDAEVSHVPWAVVAGAQAYGYLFERA